VAGALLLDDVWVQYAGQRADRPALAGVSLGVDVGERLLVVGPNGAGKSTLVRVCAGLVRPTHGRARVLGQPPRTARARLGLVGHATNLYEELTALENLLLYAELYGVPEPRPRALGLLERVGLAQRADERVGRLSRGQQQRVAIARAFLHAPPVLLLDEPDTALDVVAFDLLEELLSDPTQSVLLASHDLAAGLRLCTSALVLASGRVVERRPRVGPTDAPDLAATLRGHAAPGQPAV
jgi:heme exporter protein A